MHRNKKVLANVRILNGQLRLIVLIGKLFEQLFFEVLPRVPAILFVIYLTSPILRDFTME